LPGRFNILTLTLAVAGGLLVGFAASTLAYRYRILRVPGEPVLMRMSRELKLTPNQRDQIATIMQEARLKVRESRLKVIEQRRHIYLDALAKIRDVLTPEQQAKFDRDFGRPFLRQQQRLQRRLRSAQPPAPPPAAPAPPQGIPSPSPQNR
jgi:Spy/CpxP family protein refolding chaperone